MLYKSKSNMRWEFNYDLLKVESGRWNYFGDSTDNLI